MTISWRGLGYLGFMIPLALWGAASVIFGVRAFWAARVALLLSAAIVWFVGTKLNSQAQESGEEAPHQAFGYPMQWSVVGVFAALGLTFM